MKFNVTINGSKEVKTFDNFFDAFKCFWEGIIKSLDEGTSWQAFETANWIELESASGSKAPLLIYDARDLAYDCGIMIEPSAKGQQPTLVPPPTDHEGFATYTRKLVDGIIAAGVRISDAEVSNLQADFSKVIDKLKPVAEEIKHPELDAELESIEANRHEVGGELAGKITGTYKGLAFEVGADAVSSFIKQ